MPAAAPKLFILSFPDFSKSDLVRLSDLRSQHNSHEASLLGPHVTLAYELPAYLENRLSEAARSCAARFEPFTVLLNEIVHEAGGPIDPFHYVFLVPDKGTRRLSNLHSALYDELPQARSFLKKPFDPHVTLGKFTNAGRCQEVVEELKREAWAIEARIATLNLLAWYGDRDEVILEVPLSGTG
ncbi:MAG: 2'-5' RNA ligase family protein [bacterium]